MIEWNRSNFWIGATGYTRTEPPYTNRMPTTIRTVTLTTSKFQNLSVSRDSMIPNKCLDVSLIGEANWPDAQGRDPFYGFGYEELSGSKRSS